MSSFELVKMFLALADKLPGYITEISEAARSQDEWTDEQEKEFDAESERIFAQDHWKRND